MTDKSIEDMTASELLRWAALNEDDCYRHNTAHARLFSALEGRDYYRAADDDDRDALRAFADKIDAEILDACKRTVLESKKPIWWFKSAIARGEDWPEPREGEKFRDYLSRCFILRPRYEDGEPVQWVDPGIDWDDGKSWAFNAIDQVGQAVALGRDNIAARSAMTDDGRVRRRIAKVLGADDLPITADETVYPTYGTHTAEPCKVIAVLGQDTVIVAAPSGEHERFDGRYLVHTHPDTQERIDEDAEKFYCVYFGGYGACGTCPASAGELSKKSCKQQQILDLPRRQRELDKRTGGE